MNNKGFTLIELMATIILLSIIMTIGTVSVVSAINTSKEKSYDTLISNVKTAAKAFYEECENSYIIETEIPIEKCSINDNKLTISYKTLLDYGFLKSSAITEEDIDNDGVKEEIKIIENPKDNSNLNNCNILVTKEVDTNSGVSYVFSKVGIDSICPTY